MKQQLKKSLEGYKIQAENITKENFGFNKFGLASTAILASMVIAPVELSSQIVCGNMGAPTRTTGPCTGDIGFLNSYDCAFFDFDGDGNNELQIYYYNWSGVGSTANAYIDPINDDLALFGKGNNASGYVFPGNPVLQGWSYYLMYQDRIYVVPLTGGGGYGFITFDAGAHPAGTSHPTTGQPICCYHSALPQMWGAQTGINALNEISILTNALGECPSFPTLLPVELSKFEAISKKEAITLQWTTETETNNAGFEIERSIDGVKYEVLNFVEGKGNSSTTEHYTFEDINVKKGAQYYYRLKQIDYNGNIQYSDVQVATSYGSQLETNIYPNPSSGTAILKLNSVTEGDVSIEVYSSTGQPILFRRYLKENPQEQYPLNVQNLAPGLYYIKIELDEETNYERLLIQK